MGAAVVARAPIRVPPPIAEAAVAIGMTDPYALHLALCAGAGAAGALTFRLFSREPLSLRTVGYLAASAAFAGFVGPPLGDRLSLSHVSYLMLAAYVLGIAAPAIVPILPALGAALTKRWAAGWAAAVQLPAEAPKVFGAPPDPPETPP